METVPRWFRLSAALLLAAGLLTALPLSGPAQGADPPGIAVSGNQFLRDGAPWVPKGVMLIGALSPDHTGPAGEAAAHLDDNEMRAIQSWGADAVRYNLSQRGLDPTDSLYSAAYVDEVRRAVSLARGFGFAVVLSIQDQELGGGTRHPQPSSATIRDYDTLTAMFNDDLNVIYEIFTEPQNKADTAGWDVWRNGGPASGNQGTPAVGHQAVLDAIRATGSPTSSWPTGPSTATTWPGSRS